MQKYSVDRDVYDYQHKYLVIDGVNFYELDPEYISVMTEFKNFHSSVRYTHGEIISPYF